MDYHLSIAVRVSTSREGITCSSFWLSMPQRMHKKARDVRRPEHEAVAWQDGGRSRRYTSRWIPTPTDGGGAWPEAVRDWSRRANTASIGAASRPGRHLQAQPRHAI